MSFNNNNTEIIDLTMEIDSDHDNSLLPYPELISSPNSIYIYPIHSYASQRLDSNHLTNLNPPKPSKSSPTSKIAKYKYKTMQKKPRMSKDDSLKDFIVDDDEIEEEEEEEVVKGATVAAKKYPELILDHKYDDVSLILCVIV
jgi:hypothetical protein